MTDHIQIPNASQKQIFTQNKENIKKDKQLIVSEWLEKHLDLL